MRVCLCRANGHRYAKCHAVHAGMRGGAQCCSHVQSVSVGTTVGSLFVVMRPMLDVVCSSCSLEPAGGSGVVGGVAVNWPGLRASEKPQEGPLCRAMAATSCLGACRSASVRSK